MRTDIDWPTLPADVRSRIGFAATDRNESAGASVYALNFGLHVNDDAAQVLERRRALALQCGAVPVWMTQVHGTECAILQQVPVHHEDALTADAAWTRTSGVAATVMTADCLPVLMVDHKGRAVAAAHGGWRGLLDGVLQSTLQAFKAAGMLDGPLHAWLGPCIGPSSFEVGADVRDAFIANSPAFAAFFQQKMADPLHHGTPAKWTADLQAIARTILQDHCDCIISSDPRDTFADPMLHSYRRDKITGRQASLIWIKR